MVGCCLMLGSHSTTILTFKTPLLSHSHIFLLTSLDFSSSKRLRSNGLLQNQFVGGLLERRFINSTAQLKSKPKDYLTDPKYYNIITKTTTRRIWPFSLTIFLLQVLASAVVYWLTKYLRNCFKLKSSQVFVLLDWLSDSQSVGCWPIKTCHFLRPPVYSMIRKIM